MFHSNLSVGEVDGILASLFKSSERVVIASGYFGLSQVKKYRPDFANILKKGGQVTLIHGLGKFESIPIWEWDLDRSRFMDKYRRLKSSLLDNHSLPSYDEDKILGEWINTVRRAYKNKRV